MSNDKDYPLSRLKNPFMMYNGIEIVEVSPEHSVIKATLTDNSRNPYGMVHGGLLYTMMDCAAGTTARADNHNYVTQSVFVNYLSNIKGGSEIYAEGTVTKRGNTITIVHAIVRTADGKQLAEGTINMFRLPD